MAHFDTHFYCVLLLVFLFSCPQSEARVSKLYNELPSQTPSSSPFINEISQPPSGISPSPSTIFEGEISPSPTTFLEGDISPSPSPASVAEEGISEETPIEYGVAPTPVETVDNAYGLYGSSDFSDEVGNKKTSSETTNNDVADLDGEQEEEHDVHANGFNSESFKEVSNNNQNGYNNLPSYNENFKNGGDGENYNDNNYNGGANYDAVPASSYGSRGFNDNANDNGFGGRQGMSDTRFMENGKYYYGAQNGNHNQNDEYESVNDNNGGRYYGDRTKYEFDSMDQYEREQGYPNDQKYYVP